MLIPPMMPPIPLPHSSGPPTTPRVWKSACETCAVLATAAWRAGLREDRAAEQRLSKELTEHCRAVHWARMTEDGIGD
ncbi:hypothetical protein [Streptomyces sp. UNOC14_S4]|uniref:hypothetical protein n=1 Tax=Streptomyces sp. UNOC14_S4 TaxID=2872340 RepID=UPI001E3136FD|nr:hypothetical protein [Streptomyces sp. UNOC14_S4]MCC3768387.1 hypothetical protein [Streptomyces sp. UNOC14_S4]